MFAGFLLFLPIFWGWNGIYLMASNVQHYGLFLLMSFSIGPQAFVPPPSPPALLLHCIQLPAPLSLQIFQVAIQIFISFPFLLINKRGRQSNTILIHPTLSVPLLYVSSPFCLSAVELYYSTEVDVKSISDINFYDSLYCPHRTSILWLLCLYFIIYSFLIY